MTTVEFYTAWQRNDPKYEADARALWETLNVFPAEHIKDRLKQLCAVAYADGALIGVTTVTFVEYPLLQARFAFYRVLVDPRYRRHELAILLTRHTITVMEAWSLENPREKLQGVAAIIESAELLAKARNPVWSEYYGNLNLAGYTQAGHQVRVAWFRHAQVKASAPAESGGALV